MTYSAQKLKEKVAFDVREVISDGYGNERGPFIEQFERRAGFTFLRGGEGVMAARLEGRQPIVVRLRLCSKTKLISPDWQMRNLRDGEWSGMGENRRWTGPVFAVRSVIPSLDRQWVDVTVERGVAS